MLLLKRSTPSGYPNMAQGESTMVEICRNCFRLAHVHAARGFILRKTEVVTKIWTTQLKLNG